MIFEYFDSNLKKPNKNLIRIGERSLFRHNQLMKKYLSSNGWIAWATANTIVIDPFFHNKGTFLIAGFNPSAKFCVSPKAYDTAEKANDSISIFDHQTVAFEHEGYTIRVFICFDETYWWHGTSVNGNRYPAQQIHNQKNMQHAVALIKIDLITIDVDDGLQFWY
jgi:hypothetical protein